MTVEASKQEKITFSVEEKFPSVVVVIYKLCKLCIMMTMEVLSGFVFCVTL